MGDIKITIEGLPALLQNVSSFPKEIQEEISAEILDSVFKINGQQRRLAPKDQGGLVRNIGYERRQTQDSAIFALYSNSEQSGYVEFGTRLRVSVPAEVAAIASEMSGKGIKTKLKAREAIYAWCKRKGIEKRAWYPIFIAIMTVGIIPHPFFFKPFFDERPKLLKRIETIVNEQRKL
jgi:hypothetical protein